MPKVMPAQTPGQSRQDYSTPLDLIAAIEDRFGNLTFDLAATPENAKAPLWFSPDEDSLSKNWTIDAGGLLWLNPPFANIRPWAEKCYQESLAGARILLLTPASVGANWFQEFVHDKAMVLFLNPRIVFEGERDPYPKDCIISYFNAGVRGYDCWRWKT